MLGNILETSGCNVHHAMGDTDLLVVETAVACAEQKDTIVIADYTDILVLLIHHADHANQGIWFLPNIRMKTKKSQRCWNITATQWLIGSTVCSSILFAHVIRCMCKTGCYTLTCTCRRNGVECSMACSECSDVCSNISLSITDMDSEEDTKED